LYESVVISLVRRIIRSLKGNLIRWWIRLKVIRGVRVRVSRVIRVRVIRMIRVRIIKVRIYRRRVYEGKGI
jgi:hypothetical protein